MNISYVKTAGNGGVGGHCEEKSDFLSIGKKGQIVEGLVSNVSDKITVHLNGKEIKVPTSSVQNAKEGELRKFEIMDVSKKGILLREINNHQESVSSRGILCTTVENDKSAFSEPPKTEYLMEEQKAQEAKVQLDSVKNQMTGADGNALEEEGMSLEKYEAERLERALTRVKEQRQDREKSVEGQVESQKDYKEQIENIGKQNVKTSRGDKYRTLIAEKLERANLPVTEENIEKMVKALELSGAAGNMSDKATAYMIDHQLDATIENVYHAQYSGSSQKYAEYKASYQSYQTPYASYTSTYEATHIGEEEKAWKAIEEQAKKVIESAGLEVNEETLAQAKWLFDKKLPLTENTLKNLIHLNEIKDNYDEIPIIDEMVKTYASGQNPEQTNLSMPMSANEEVIKIFLEQIGQMESELSEVSYLNLSQITAKRQLEEIRLKMTSEAGVKLLAKGISLDTGGLERVVEGLREIEKNYYQKLLQEANVPQTEGNIELLEDTTKKLNVLKEAPIYALSVTFQSFRQQTVNSFSEVVSSLKVRMDKSSQTYEALMTKSRKDMGDSIEKAFRNIDDLLKETGLDLTDANRRAVKILGYNSMEITAENVTQVKACDEQVNQLFENLHPAVTVELIKQGINPLTIPIHELNDKITQIKDEFGITDHERFSTFLRKLDLEGKHSKKGGLSEEERKAFIGIYRLVNQVEKSKGAAVGNVLENGQDMTLNNLLMAVRTRKTGGIDKKIDDNFGTLEHLSFQKESITDQINYMSHVLEDIKENLSPDKLMEVIGDSDILDGLDAIKDMPIETLREQLKQAEGNRMLEQEYGEEKVEEIRNLIHDSEDAITFLSNHHQPVTLRNLVAANQLLDGGKHFFENVLKEEKELALNQSWKKEEADKEGEIKDILENLSEDVGSAEKLQTDYEDLENRFHELLETEYENPDLTVTDLKKLRMMSRGIELAKHLSHQESYQIPILTGDTVTSMNLTIISGGNDTGKISIQMDSEALGKINMELTVKQQMVKGYVFCTNKEGYQAFSEKRELLKEALGEIGLELKQLDYGMDSKWNNRFRAGDADSDKTETKILYQAAKVLVQMIKNIESGNQS